MAKTTAIETTTIDPVQDKRIRYKIEVDPSQTVLSHGRTVRMVAVLTKRDRPDETLQVVLYNLDLPVPRSFFNGPPWKRHHADLYAQAVIAERKQLGGVLPPLGAGSDLPVCLAYKEEKTKEEETKEEETKDAPNPVAGLSLALPPSVPPSTPCCPLCGRHLTYQCAHVGGRGTCWRHGCPAAEYGVLDGILDGANCQYIERWQN